MPSFGALSFEKEQLLSTTSRWSSTFGQPAGTNSEPPAEGEGEQLRLQLGVEREVAPHDDAVHLRAALVR